MNRHGRHPWNERSKRLHDVHFCSLSNPGLFMGPRGSALQKALLLRRSFYFSTKARKRVEKILARHKRREAGIQKSSPPWRRCVQSSCVEIAFFALSPHCGYRESPCAMLYAGAIPLFITKAERLFILTLTSIRNDYLSIQQLDIVFESFAHSSSI